MSAQQTDQVMAPAPLMAEMTLEQAKEALEALRREYNTTVLVVAILTERLQEATGAIQLTITDLALHNPPDLDAHRNTARHAVLLKATR